MKFVIKQSAIAHTQIRFLKFTKGSWEGELSFREPFAFFISNNTLQVTSFESEKRSFKDAQHFIMKLFANIGLH